MWMDVGVRISIQSDLRPRDGGAGVGEDLYNLNQRSRPKGRVIVVIPVLVAWISGQFGIILGAGTNDF